MRFNQFHDSYWIKTSLKDVAKKINAKNKNKFCKNVISNSAQHGLIRQIDYFDKEIAQNESIENYTIINKDDFVYNPRKSIEAPYGPVNIYNFDETGIVSPLYLCFSIQNINKKFLHYYFKSKAWHRFVYLYGDSGARHDRVSIKDEVFFSQQLSIPTSSDEIEKITDLLFQVEQRINTQSKIIEDLESLEKTLNDTIFDQLVKSQKLYRFSNIYQEAKEGGTPDTSHFEYYNNGAIPFIKIDDITNKHLTRNNCFITELGMNKSSAWLIPTNSILYSNGATIGSVTITTYPVSTKQGILGIVPQQDVLTEYLYYLLKSKYFKKEICKITTQGTMKSAYIKDIDQILIPQLEKSEQNDIIKKLQLITLKIQKEKDMLDLYKKHKAYLLQNMFI